jgi:RNA polymerase sigma factor (TIGR02999 family)
MRRERADHSLEPNAIVNELYLRLIGSQPITYQDRAHFFAIAAQTMRRILIDYARAKVADKRGGAQRRVPLSDVAGGVVATASDQLLDLDTLLSALATADPRAARVVELRFFGGLREEDVAEVLQVSVITVKRDWKAARAWLAARLTDPR